jgi:hypothetical protein
MGIRSEASNDVGAPAGAVRCTPTVDDAAILKEEAGPKLCALDASFPDPFVRTTGVRTYGCLVPEIR